MMMLKPRVLHICGDFAKQKIYSELLLQLDSLGTEQFVYVPVRSAAEIGVNCNNNLANARHHYSHILRPSHRFFFRTKIKRIVLDLLSHVEPAVFTAVHAHFLYSDGAVALALNKRFALPYMVAVRNTDVNLFMRLRPDLHRICWDIIERAQYVIFVTPSYLEVMLRRAPARHRALLRAKARIVPNGLGKFWIDCADASTARARKHLNLLYVGDFSKNKNVITSIRATALLNRQRETCLTLVGGGGDGEAQVDALLGSGKFPFVTRMGRVEEPAALARIYREHDIFVMPSFHETFGVAYLEALSQGLPVVFTRGQGIDGYFQPGTVGEAVDPTDTASVVSGILMLERRMDSVRAQCVERAKEFNWPRIARTYFDLYCEVGVIAARVGAS